MGKVYEHALCNIAAASMEDSETEGLFLDDCRHLISPIMVRCGDVDVEAFDPRVSGRDVDLGPLQKVGV